MYSMYNQISLKATGSEKIENSIRLWLFLLSQGSVRLERNRRTPLKPVAEPCDWDRASLLLSEVLVKLLSSFIPVRLKWSWESRALPAKAVCTSFSLTLRARKPNYILLSSASSELRNILCLFCFLEEFLGTFLLIILVLLISLILGGGHLSCIVLLF